MIGTLFAGSGRCMRGVLYLLVGACLLVPATLQAAIISTGGDVTQASPAPDSVVPSAVDPNNGPTGGIIAFSEKQGVTLPDTRLMVVTPMASNAIIPVSIPAGANVNSHLLYADPGALDSEFTGTIEFGSNILGIIHLSEQQTIDQFLSGAASLDATDRLLGLNTTLYPTDSFITRGAGGFPSTDMIEFLSATEIRVTFSTAANNMDQIRVLTAVPGPSALSLLVMSFLGFASPARKRLRSIRS